MTDVPLHLLRLWNPAAANDDAATDWGRACREANRRATFEMTAAEREQARKYGLVVRRDPADLGEHHIDDALGRDVMRELAAKKRGG